MTSMTTLDRVVIRFAGDSGDGMQLVGDRFTELSAAFGNDLATLPNYPAEIRAPAGTLNGVSSFQVHISDHDITTPGDAPNVLVAMNPAALMANLGDMARGSTLIVNADNFTERDLEKAECTSNPLTDGTLENYTVYEVPMTSITVEATKPLGVKPRDAEPRLLDVHPACRSAAGVDQREVRVEADGSRREPRGVQGGPQLR